MNSFLRIVLGIGICKVEYCYLKYLGFGMSWDVGFTFANVHTLLKPCPLKDHIVTDCYTSIQYTTARLALAQCKSLRL